MGVRVIVEYDNDDDEVQALAIRMWIKNSLPVGLAMPMPAIPAARRQRERRS
jgi:hypothetical protein